MQSLGCFRHLQARLQLETEAAAAAEERLAQVMAAMERCQASAAELDTLADAYSDLQVSCVTKLGSGWIAWLGRSLRRNYVCQDWPRVCTGLLAQHGRLQRFCCPHPVL